MTIFPLIRNYNTDKTVDGVLYEVARQLETNQASIIEMNQFYVYCQLKNGTHGYWWIANKFYAYAGNGRIGFFIWKDTMPSRTTAKRLDAAVRKSIIHALHPTPKQSKSSVDV